MAETVDATDSKFESSEFDSQLRYKNNNILPTSVTVRNLSTGDFESPRQGSIPWWAARLG